MRTIKPYENFDLCLLNWAVIEPFWRKNIYHPLDRNRLVPAFNNTWFATNLQGEQAFIAGAITYDPNQDTVLFVNGRHRTNLILRYTSIVPVAVDKTILNHPVLRQAIIETTAKELEVELPRLPILHFNNFLVND
jgi:hypothetical protein